MINTSNLSAEPDQAQIEVSHDDTRPVGSVELDDNYV
jgi:hypothetical protein